MFDLIGDMLFDVVGGMVIGVDLIIGVMIIFVVVWG